MDGKEKGPDRKIVNRLAKASGHLDAVRRMLEDGRDCRDVLLQLAAVRSAIMKTEKLLLRDYISSCLDEALRTGSEEAENKMNEAIDRFIR